MKIPRLGLGGWIGVGVGGLLLLLVVTLLLLDWNLLRHPIERFASARSGRVVRLQGALEVHPWSLSPAVSLQGLVVGNPPWENGPPLLQVEQLHARLELLPLLRGRGHPGAARADPPATLPAPGQGGPRQLDLRESEAHQCARSGAAEIAGGAQPADPGRNAGNCSTTLRHLKAQGTVQAHERESAQALASLQAQGQGHDQQGAVCARGCRRCAAGPDAAAPVSV